MNAFSTFALATTLYAAAALASAQDHAHGGHDAHGAHGAQAGAKATATSAAELVDGEVKKIDKGAGKITLRHGELKSLNMPAMSMVFRVKDAAMLDQVKTGDKVKFAADRVNGAVTIVELKPAQ